MGRQNKDPTTIGSSIVLLQERFKQLQRLKQMREDRQLLKLLPQSRDGCDHEAVKLSMDPSNAAFQDPLAPGLNFEPLQFPSAAHNFFKKTYVDTSLRL